jgi:hypothetical protein
MAVGCATEQQKQQLSKNEISLVGGWISTKFDFTQHYVERHADRTFTEYRFNAVEGDRKAATYVLKGRWKLKGKYYELTYDDVNGAGKPYLLKIYKHTPDIFEYVSNDGCPISERRASEKELRDLSVDPFMFITPEARSEYTIEKR